MAQSLGVSCPLSYHRLPSLVSMLSPCCKWRPRMVALRWETQAQGLSSWVCFLDHSISASKILASPGEGKALHQEKARHFSCRLSCWASCREGKKEGDEPGTSSKSLGFKSLGKTLSLALTAFFIALKKSKIRNHAKVSWMAMKTASVN